MYKHHSSIISLFTDCAQHIYFTYNMLNEKLMWGISLPIQDHIMTKNTFPAFVNAPMMILYYFNYNVGKNYFLDPCNGFVVLPIYNSYIMMIE